MYARNVAPGIWRLPFDSSTLPPFDHTNGWLITDGDHAALIDPGFRDMAGLEMLEGAIHAAGAIRLESVWLTHTHHDHTEGLARLLDHHPDVDVFVHEREISRLEHRERLHAVADETLLAIGEREARVLHTPGHSPGHLAFVLVDTGWIFVGDLLAGSGSVWIGAPEGDIGAYLRSLDRIAGERARVLAPGHGEPLLEPDRAVDWARRHRLEREAQVLHALRSASGPLTVSALRSEVYPGLESGLGALAERSLVSHLEKLMVENHVERLEDDPFGPYRTID